MEHYYRAVGETVSLFDLHMIQQLIRTTPTCYRCQLLTGTPLSYCSVVLAVHWNLIIVLSVSAVNWNVFIVLTVSTVYWSLIIVLFVVGGYMNPLYRTVGINSFLEAHYLASGVNNLLELHNRVFGVKWRVVSCLQVTNISLFFLEWAKTDSEIKFMDSSGKFNHS